MEQDFTAGNLRRLSETDYAVADNEPDIRGWRVVDGDGTDLGKVEDLIIDTDARKVRYLELDVDAATSSNDSGTAYASMAEADIDDHNKRVILRSGLGGLVRNQAIGRAASGASHTSPAGTGAVRSDTSRTHDDVQRLTRAEEEVRLGKRTVEAGEVRVGKHVETEHRRDDVTVMREEVHIERRPVSGMPAGEEIRASGDEIRVPIIEEEVVVEKRPVVKEELVVSKERVQETRPVDVEVRREEFDIHDERGLSDSDRDRSNRGER